MLAYVMKNQLSSTYLLKKIFTMSHILIDLKYTFVLSVRFTSSIFFPCLQIILKAICGKSYFCCFHCW